MILVILLAAVHSTNCLGFSENFKEFDHFKNIGINENLLQIAKNKRSLDPKFYGHPKSRDYILARKFNILNLDKFDQADSLVQLLIGIAKKYLNRCPTFIYYDKFVEESEGFFLQRLFATYPTTFYHAKLSSEKKLENRRFDQDGDENCKSYILFLSNPSMASEIIGPQLENRVIVVARSSQWKVREFLSSPVSSNLINLLVIGESITSDPAREQPYVLYTHELYSDSLGTNSPVVLTSWIKGMLARPHINLFPPKLTNGFSGHRFTIAAVNQPPYIFRFRRMDISGTVNSYWDGIEFRLMTLLSDRLNFTFDIQEPPNVELVGTGDAVCLAVQYRQADLGMAGVYITEERMKQVDMSYGHSRDCATFVTLASKALPKYRAILGPFQWPVWLALIIVYLGAIFPLSFTDRFSLRHLIGNWTEIENMFWYVFGTFTNSLTFSGKYSWSKSGRNSTRILIGFYWVFTIIITSCYTGSIIAFVTLPAFPDTVDSVNDLLGLFFRVGTLNKGGWESWFANSTHFATDKLFRKMEFVNDINEGIGNVTKSFFWNYAFLGSKGQLEYLIQSNFSDDTLSKRSALHLSEECFAPFHIGYTFPKYSVHSNRIDHFIMMSSESGILMKITNDVQWNMQRSSSGKLLQASSTSPLREILREDRQLTTADTEGMFLLMGLGYLVGGIVLVSEIVGGITNKCREILKRSRLSITALSSGRNSASISNEEDLKAHLQRKALKAKLQSQKPKFSFLREFRLTKETFNEIYGDGEEVLNGFDNYGNAEESDDTLEEGGKNFEPHSCQTTSPTDSDLEGVSIDSEIFGSPVNNKKGLTTIYENLPDFM
ncbi:hypothetical protein ACFFRR_004937 [Megaselia abdita]